MPGLSPEGLPLPLDSDRLRDAALHVRELAYALERGFRIVPNVVNKVGLVIQGAAGGQTANLTEWRSTAGALLARVSSIGILQAAGGRFGANNGDSGSFSTVHSVIADPAARGLTVKAAAAQTSALIEAQNSAGVPLLAVKNDGGLLASAQTAHAFGGAGVFDTSTVLNVSTSNAGARLMALQGAAGQIEDLTQWRNSAGAVLAKVTPSGAVMANGGLIANRVRLSGILANKNLGGAAGVLECFVDGNLYVIPFYHAV